MLEDKISLTKELKKFITSTRKDHNLKLTDLVEKSKSTNYIHETAWYSQVEGSRTQTIKRDELINIFMMILDLSYDDAEEYIESFLNTSKNNDSKSKQLSLFDIDEDTPSIEEQKKEFNNQVKNIIEQFQYFFDEIENKEQVLKLVKSINFNMHSCDLGFIIGLYSLAWFKITGREYDEKKIIFKQLIKIINENELECKDCKQCKNDNQTE